MKSHKVKIIYILAAVLVLIWGVIMYVSIFMAKKPSSYYYNIIKTQENIDSDFTLKDDEMKEIFACKELKNKNTKSQYEDCLRAFYTEYTVANGPERAFMHLAKVEKEYPDLLPGCHYISHGIGHGTLRLNKNDVAKAYEILNTKDYFKNVATCGNGYFHGVIEEYAKNTKDKDELIKLLKPICANPKTKNNCYHGVGHAAVVQLDYEIKDALYVCDGLTDDPINLFGCHTGAFMEIGQYGIDELFKVENGKTKFVMCDSMDVKYRTACYMEQSSYSEWFTKEPRNYTRNIGFCKQIENNLYRMSCIKLNAIRAIRISRYEKIAEMCANTSSNAERVMCTAIIADRMGGSIDKSKKKSVYSQGVKDTCATLPFYLQLQCQELVFDASDRLFYTSPRDLSMPEVSMKRFENFFKY
jgi:hypothetical protein